MAKGIGDKKTCIIRLTCATEELYDFATSIENKSEFVRQQLISTKEKRNVNLKVSNEILEKYVSDEESDYIIDRLLTNYYRGNIVFVDSINQVMKFANEYENKNNLKQLNNLKSFDKQETLQNDLQEMISCDSTSDSDEGEKEIVEEVKEGKSVITIKTEINNENYSNSKEDINEQVVIVEKIKKSSKVLNNVEEERPFKIDLDEVAKNNSVEEDLDDSAFA